MWREFAKRLIEQGVVKSRSSLGIVVTFQKGPATVGGRYGCTC
ncbi:MAG: hypothetical protein JWO71_938 [Candidatus Acidoferrum typicum]|nr:hypothetical protein [Candidatus Acidoferrum typicum]